MALASEVELDDEASADSGSTEEDDRAEGDADDDASPGGSGAGEEPRMATSPALEKKPTRYPLPKIPKIEDKVSADTGLEPVAGKNAAATTSEPREASVIGGKVLALSAGAFFAADVYVARRTFWS